MPAPRILGMKRTRTSRAWMRAHVNDPWVQRAQREGYRSRAAFKLLEIDRQDHLLRPGMSVVDLGAAPGGWSQVAAARVAPGGRVIALDLLEMAPIRGVEFIQADFGEPEALAALERALGGTLADLVISDMAPNISGVVLTDRARSEALGELALDFADRCLKPGGSVLVKCFHGSGFDALRAAFRERFERVAVRKPEASRDRSSEVFLLGQGMRARPGGV